jgi:AraC-like DNA-binding protein
LTIARNALAAAGPRISDLHGFVFQGALGRLIADHMMLLIRRLPHLDMQDASTAVGATVGLIASCMVEALRLNHGAADAHDAEIRNRVSHYIDEHLDVAGLTTKMICDELGLSRSVLYRAFTPLAGVADYIRARRLEAVHVLLEDAKIDLKISGMARDVGFTSEPHFSRAFKQRYGYSPRQARPANAMELADLAAVVDSHTGPDIFRAWLARLA